MGVGRRDRSVIQAAAPVPLISARHQSELDLAGESEFFLFSQYFTSVPGKDGGGIERAGFRFVPHIALNRRRFGARSIGAGSMARSIVMAFNTELRCAIVCFAGCKICIAANRNSAGAGAKR